MAKDFPGQLVTHSAHGHEFRHDPGAKGGKVYEGDTLIGTFSNVDAGDEDTPCGIYAAAPGEDDYAYVDTYDGASAYLTARNAVRWSGTSEQTWAVAYAVRSTLATLVREITETRELLASDEGKSAAGVVRISAQRGNEERERLYRQLVDTFATLPEEIRPDMRSRLVQLPEVDES